MKQVIINIIIFLIVELAKKFKEMPPEDIARRFGDRFAHKDGNIRSQIEELQRLNTEKMRRINGYVYKCVSLSNIPTGPM